MEKRKKEEPPKESLNPSDIHERLMEDKKIYAQIFSMQRGPSISKIQTQDIYNNEEDNNSSKKHAADDHSLLKSLGLNSHNKSMYTLYKIAGKFPEKRVKNFLNRKSEQQQETLQKLNAISEKYSLCQKIKPKIDLLHSLCN